MFTLHSVYVKQGSQNDLQFMLRLPHCNPAVKYWRYKS